MTDNTVLRIAPNLARLYATDASVYEQLPAGVVYPLNEEDCIALVRQAKKHGQGLICRGGGTSIAGQCVGPGVVVDFSRHMANILSEPEADTIWVQPGVVLDDLNDYLRKSGLQFPVDISTSSRCTIGGMLGNNAAGSHSIVYGTTRENVIEVDAVLADGSVARFGPLDGKTLHTKRRMSGLEGKVYRSVCDAIDQHRDAILAASPDVGVIRRNTGYALDALAQRQPWVAGGMSFSLVPLLCGSEGTLALITAIRLRLSPVVRGKALVCIHFDSLDAALKANTRLLHCEGLASSELIDNHILQAAASHPGQRANSEWVVGKPAAVLVAEFFADEPLKAKGMAERAAAAMRADGWGTAWPVLDGAEASKVWALRKAGLGLLMGLRQRARPVAVIEDSAVPVMALSDFAHDIGQLMAGFGISCVYYGHASVGLLHLRPALDLDVESDRAIFRSIATEMANLVKRYRGALSGEHGDGRLRAPFLREFLGDEVYALLVGVKRAFDPYGIFNPGKILSDLPVDADLRRRPRVAMQIASGGVDWSEEGGFDLVLERCNGSGNCRQGAGRGAMCPTFQATDDELYSTRGRANLLRQAYSNPSKTGLNDPALAEAMDTCLGCKACKSECPSGVDMARMKTEFLYQQRQHSRTGQLKQWIMRLQPAFLSMIEAQPAFLRTLAGHCFRTPLAMRMLGLKRKPPLMAPRTLRRSLKNSLAKERVSDDKTHPVLLLVDPYINQFESEIGKAAVFVLQKLGFTPYLYYMDCSLRFLVSEGFLDEARKGLRRLMDEFSRRAMPIVGLEPAELLLLRDEAASLLGDAGQEDLASRCFLLDEFLQRKEAAHQLQDLISQVESYQVYFHPHCHERIMGRRPPLETLLNGLLNIKAEIISTGCCGMGGTFGYFHGKLSEKIFHKNTCVPTEIQGSASLIVSGFSCRQQFRDLNSAGLSPVHLAQFIQSLMVTATVAPTSTAMQG